MNSLAKNITREEIMCARDDIFTPTTVKIGVISYNDSLVISRVQQTLYDSILHSNLIPWYSGKFGKGERLLNGQVH